MIISTIIFHYYEKTTPSAKPNTSNNSGYQKSSRKARNRSKLTPAIIKHTMKVDSTIRSMDAPNLCRYP